MQGTIFLTRLVSNCIVSTDNWRVLEPYSYGAVTAGLASAFPHQAGGWRGQRISTGELGYVDPSF